MTLQHARPWGPEAVARRIASIAPIAGPGSGDLAARAEAIEEIDVIAAGLAAEIQIGSGAPGALTRSSR